MSYSRSPALVNGKYIITSRGGLAAIQEKIDMIQEQHKAAVGNNNPESVRIYNGVLVALRAIYSAGQSGISPTELQMQVRQQSGRLPLSRQQQDEVMRLVTAHMDPIARTEVEIRERKSGTVPTKDRPRSAAPQTHSLARERLNQGRLK